MNRSVAYLISGGRLHLQHGPIDLIIGVDGASEPAFAAATQRFETVLDELMAEIDVLRAPVSAQAKMPDGVIARAMARACWPHHHGFVTMMAAVAGAVADEVLAAMVRTGAAGPAGPLTRAYVNNGGDIALHLGVGQRYIAAMATPEGRDLGRIEILAKDTVRGIATSGQGGRSLSFGIAESVTVLARDAAMADVAATLIANAVDLPDHRAVERVAACELQPDSDLGTRLVMAHVGALTEAEIAEALSRGQAVAEAMLKDQLIDGAALYLRGAARFVGEIGGMRGVSQNQKRVRYA